MNNTMRTSLTAAGGTIVAAAIALGGTGQAAAATATSSETKSATKTSSGGSRPASGNPGSGNKTTSPKQTNTARTSGSKQTGSATQGAKGSEPRTVEVNGQTIKIKEFTNSQGETVLVKSNESGDWVKTTADGKVLESHGWTNPAKADPTSGPKSADPGTETSTPGNPKSAHADPTSGPKQVGPAAGAKSGEPRTVEVNGQTIKIKEFTNSQGETVLVKSNESGDWVKTTADGKVLESHGWTNPAKATAAAGSVEAAATQSGGEGISPKQAVSDARYAKKGVEFLNAARLAEKAEPGSFGAAMGAQYNPRVATNAADGVLKNGKIPALQTIDKLGAKFSLGTNAVATLDAYQHGDTYGVFKSGVGTATGLYGLVAEGAFASHVGLAAAGGMAVGEWARPYLNEAPLMKSASELTDNAMQKYGVGWGTAIGAVTEAAAIPGAAVQASVQGVKNWSADYNNRLQNSGATARDDYLHPASNNGQQNTSAPSNDSTQQSPDVDSGRADR